MRNDRPHVLVVHSRLETDPPSGGVGLCCWAIEALLDMGLRVTLLVPQTPDVRKLDSQFGTSLAEREFDIVVTPLGLAGVMRGILPRLGLLEHAAISRHAASLCKKLKADICFGTSNEMTFPVPWATYTHFPALCDERPEIDFRAYHASAIAVRAYRSLCKAILRFEKGDFARGIQMVNSGFIRDLFREVHGVEPRVVAPPAPGDFPRLDWDAKDDAFGMIGRFAPEKALPDAIRIVDLVRRNTGRQLELRLYGAWDCQGVERREIEDCIARHSDFVRVEAGLSRKELLTALGRLRYGLHAMQGEHFGMAVAELLRAGAIPFVPNSGGPKAIVGDREELLWSTVEEAADKIAALISEPKRAAGLHRQLRGEGEEYSEAAFMQNIQGVAQELLDMRTERGATASA